MIRFRRPAARFAIFLVALSPAFSEADGLKPHPTLFSIRPGTGTIFSKTPDDLWTATIEDDKFYFVDRRTKRKDGEPIPTAYPPQRWSFSPDGRYLVIGEGYKRGEANHGLIEVWEVASRTRVMQFKGTASSPGFGSVTYVGFGSTNGEIRYTAEKQRYDGK